MEATLLVELLTEELPPKSLSALSSNFGNSVLDGLKGRALAPATVEARFFSTPRRLAVVIPVVKDSAPDSTKEVDGPPVSAKPEAVSGFARKQGIEPSVLQQRDGPKGKIYFARVAVR